MTSSKNIIIVIVVIVVFIAAAFVLYNGVGQKEPVAPVPSGNLSTSILPHGNQLEFDQVKKYNPDGKLFNYPKVSPDNIGVNLPGILKVKSDSQ